MDSGEYSSKQEGMGYGHRVAQKGVNTTDAKANQYTMPAIQNGSPYGQVPNTQNFVYAQQPNQLQQQPYIQNGNSLETQLAMQKISSDAAEIKRLTQQLEAMKNGQNNQEKKDSVFENLSEQIRNESDQKVIDAYTNQKESYRKEKDELEQLRKYKAEQEEKDRKQRDKEELEKKIEEERSKLEDQQNQINDTFEALESVDTSALTDPNALRNYLDEIDNISDIRKFRKLVEEGFEDRTEENKKYEEQNRGYLKTLEDKFSENQREITNKQSELNMLENNKSIFRKFIEWITGSKDEKAEKLKEKIQKLRDDIKNDMVDIDKQKEVLKNIVLEGVEIIKERNEKIKELQDKEREERDEKRKMVYGYKGTEEYNKIKREALHNSIKNKIMNINSLVGVQEKVNKNVAETWKRIYPEKDMQNGNAENNLNSINKAKEKKGSGRGW